MQVLVENIDALKRKLKITLPKEKVTIAIDQYTAKMAKNIKIPGFRPGKVPLSVIKKRYGDSIRKESLSNLINDSLQSAISQEKLNPATTPKIESIDLVKIDPFEFSATFEVLPEIGEIKFDMKNLVKPNVDVTESDVEDALQKIYKHQAELNPVERAAKVGDSVSIDFDGTIDGDSFEGASAKDFALVLGDNRMVAGFEDGIVGMQSGDEKVIEVTFPEKYFMQDIAGKKAKFTVKLLSVSEVLLPDINEDFVRNVGIKSGKMEDLHAEVRRNIVHGIENKIKSFMKDKLFDCLIKQNPITVPDELVLRETKRLHEQSHSRDQNSGGKKSSGSCKHTSQDLKDMSDTAKNNIILSLLLVEMVKKHKLDIDEADIQRHIESLSASYENPDQMVRWYNSKPDVIREIKNQLLEDKVLEILLENAHIEEKQFTYSDFQLLDADFSRS